MIDVQAAYDELSEDRKEDARTRRYATHSFWQNFQDRITDIDGFTEGGGSYKSREDEDGVPQAWPSTVEFDGETPSKLVIKVSGRASNKTYQRTLRLEDGMLDPDYFQSKIDELRTQIWDVEREARSDIRTNADIEEDIRDLLSEAFGEENIGGNSNKAEPVKVDVKKDGSVRLQITDLSADAMMKIAQFIADNNLNLDNG